MKRPPFAKQPRRGDTDATVMTLSGLVLLLVLLLAFSTGLALWQYRQAAGFRAQLAAQGGGPAFVVNGNGTSSVPEMDAETRNRVSIHLTGMVVASSMSPLEVLPLLDQAPQALRMEVPDAEPGEVPPE